MTAECVQSCIDSENQCLESCDDNPNCVFECERKATSCAYVCPCYDGCPNGCDDCPSSFCTCFETENNDDFIICRNQFEEAYNECINQCPISDFVCIGTCSREYQNNIDDCPCNTNCPEGCPCPNYECPVTTSSTVTTTMETSTTPIQNLKTAVLVLNTKSRTNPPVLIKSDGHYDTNTFYFRYGKNTTAYYSSSITFKNEFYIFGGNGGQARQISKLVGTEVLRVGTLAFDHYYATSGNIADEIIYLCFHHITEGLPGTGSRELRLCRYATEPIGEYSESPLSNHDHKATRIGCSPSKSRL